MSKPAGKSFAHPSDLVRLEYAATTRASPAVAWKIFTDWHKWPEFTDLYSELVWTEGEPWKVGSRLRMEIVRPVNFIVHRVITICRPSEFIAWIDHSGQSTVEQWVSFQVGPDQRTSVEVVSQLAGTTPRVAGLSFAKFIESNVKAWFDAFCHACDHVHSENQS